MIFKYGGGELWNGDCLELMRNIPDGSVDMVLCDLPYGTTACKWDTIIPFAPLWSEYWRVAKPNAAIVLTASQPFTTALINSQIDRFKYEWIWKKDKPSNFALANKQPLKYHENICVFYKSQPTYNKEMQEREGSGKQRVKYIVNNSNQKSDHLTLGDKPKMFGELKNPSSIQEFSTGQRQSIVHPTQKPVALFEYLIKTYTNEGETVLDNCSGSGTTAIAAVNTGRRFICIEKDLGYYLASCGRMFAA
jgi:site-specific DNA-methyltransferase (adenine-specific)